MNSNLLISIVMITYNHEKYIAEAVAGVLMQEGNFEVELIIADDCSPDKTREVVESFKSHPNYHWIKYTRHAANKGMIGNFIWTLEQCKGEYIALCDGDDYWTDPLKLQKQVDFLEANPEYVLCFHKVMVRKGDEIVEDFITHIPEERDTFIAADLAKGNFIHTPSVVFRNNLITIPHWFAESPIGDYPLYVLLALQGKIKYIKDTMAHYRYGVGFWSKLNNTKMLLYWLKMLRLLNLTLPKNISMCIYETQEKPLLEKIIHEWDVLNCHLQYLKNSTDYKVGNFFLRPVRFLRRIFKI